MTTPTTGERRGIIALMAIIIITVLIVSTYTSVTPSQVEEVTDTVTVIKQPDTITPKPEIKKKQIKEKKNKTDGKSSKKSTTPPPPRSPLDEVIDRRE